MSDEKRAKILSNTNIDIPLYVNRNVDNIDAENLVSRGIKKIKNAFIDNYDIKGLFQEYKNEDIVIGFLFDSREGIVV